MRMSRSAISALLVFSLLFSGYVIESAADVEPDVFDDDVEGDVTIETEEDDSVFSAEDDAFMAADEDEIEQRKQEPVYGIPGVTSSFFFPDNENQKFPIGMESKILVGFHNGAEMPLNITMVAGFSRTVQEYAYSVQNFTILSTATSVAVNEQVTVAYTFVPRPDLRPMDLFFTFTLVYETPPLEDPNNPEEGPLKRQFGHVVFNSTVEVIEPPGLDTELVMLCLTVLAMIAGILFLIFSAFFNGKSKVFRKMKGSKKPVAKDRNPADEKDQWLKGTYAAKYTTRSKSQSAAGNGSDS